MVLDAGSKRLVDGAVKEDDILKENVTSIPPTKPTPRRGLSEH